MIDSKRKCGVWALDGSFCIDDGGGSVVVITAGSVVDNDNGSERRKKVRGMTGEWRKQSGTRKKQLIT